MAKALSVLLILGIFVVLLSARRELASAPVPEEGS
jgi:hypothetical protein